VQLQGSHVYQGIVERYTYLCLSDSTLQLQNVNHSRGNSGSWCLLLSTSFISTKNDNWAVESGERRKKAEPLNCGAVERFCRFCTATVADFNFKSDVPGMSASIIPRGRHFLTRAAGDITGRYELPFEIVIVCSQPYSLQTSRRSVVRTGRLQNRPWYRTCRLSELPTYRTDISSELT
jgi:hypothetical protein